MTSESPFTVTYRTDAPIIQYSINSSYRIREHQPKLIEMTLNDSKEATSPYHLLLDIREIRVEWNDLVFGLGETRDVNRSMQNPLSRGTLIVTNSAVLKIAMKALGQPQYGSAKIAIFETIEEAVRYVQAGEAQAA